MVLLGAGDVRCSALRARGNDYLVDVKVTQQGCVYARLQADIDGQLFYLVEQVVEQTTVFGVGQSGKEQGAAQTITAFKQGHPMATQGGDARRFKTCRATADHRHMLRSHHWRDDAFALMAGLRVDRAFDSLVDEYLADAHVAINTRADRLQLTGCQLVRQLRVGQQFASHGDEVAVVGGNRVFARLRFDSSDGNHRNAYALFDRPSPLEKGARLLHQWRLSEGHATGDSGVGRNADRVGPGRFGQAGYSFGILKGNAAGGKQLFGIQAQPHAKT